MQIFIHSFIHPSTDFQFFHNILKSASEACKKASSGTAYLKFAESLLQGFFDDSTFYAKEVSLIAIAQLHDYLHIAFVNTLSHVCHSSSGISS